MNEQALLGAIEERLLEAERRIDLLGRCTPGNFQRELELARADVARAVQFEYAPLPDWSRVSELFDRAEEALSRNFEGVVARLLIERIGELRCEVGLLDMRGRPELSVWARRRYPAHAQDEEAARQLAEEWLAGAGGAESDGAGWDGADSNGVESTSSESTETVELLEFARTHPSVSALGVSVFERDMPSLAAVSDEALLVRRGARVTRPEAERVLLHELYGHLAPRQRARAEGPPFRLGTRGCSEEEEGRALLLEQRAGLLLAARRVELAARHLAVDWTWDGATLAEVRARLQSRGVGAEVALRSGLRALRGGSGRSPGMGRERIYLLAYLRVKQAFEQRPELERWFERGRLSLSGIAELEAASEAASESAAAQPSSKSTQTGV
ncbi:MAG TPA: tyrosine/phenylalanine carboxypeptidase domain-containing protein [Polyangiaceae bacterium]|nr:tyrosine/phenylalanine carboxypeptidase domain-containing protein [Polyangiaceae bacterium]